MVHDDAVAVIDFQDALLAPAQYDLASLLNDRETDQVVTPAVEEQLVDYYLERSARMGPDPRADRDEFRGVLPALRPAAGFQGGRPFSLPRLGKGQTRLQAVHRPDT